MKPFYYHDELEAMGVTKESYIQVYRKIWATLRHDLYMSIQAFKKENPGCLSVPKEKVEELWEREFENFESIRQEIYKLIIGQDLPWKEAKRTMLKAYIEFAAVSSGQFDKDGNMIGELTRSRWPDLVNECTQKHSIYIKEMSEGKFYPNIEKDPRLNAGPDEKVDIQATQDSGAGAAEGYNRQKSKILNETVHQTPMAKSATKFVNKFVERARIKKEASLKAQSEGAETNEAADSGVTLEKSDEPAQEVIKEEPVAEAEPVVKEETTTAEVVEAVEEVKATAPEVVEAMEEVKATAPEVVEAVEELKATAPEVAEPVEEVKVTAPEVVEPVEEVKE